MSMPKPAVSKTKDRRVVMAMRHAMVADALAMPVHWFYRTADILRAFPKGMIQLFDAPTHHPSSIMSLHSKRQGGRRVTGERQTNVVGDVILRDKACHWDQPGVHYHQGMKAGENTLNAHTVLWLLQALVETGGTYQEAAFLRRYIEQMTATEATHPDTYAESYHRGFFANWAQGRDPKACAAVTHDTPSIGGLVRIGPLALLLLHRGEEVAEVKSVVARHLDLTHPDAGLKKVCFQYVDLINDLLAATNQDAAERCLKQHLMIAAGQHFKRKPVEQWSNAEVVGGPALFGLLHSRFLAQCALSGQSLLS